MTRLIVILLFRTKEIIITGADLVFIVWQLFAMVTFVPVLCALKGLSFNKPLLKTSILVVLEVMNVRFLRWLLLKGYMVPVPWLEPSRRARSQSRTVAVCCSYTSLQTYEPPKPNDDCWCRHTM